MFHILTCCCPGDHGSSQENHSQSNLVPHGLNKKPPLKQRSTSYESDYPAHYYISGSQNSLSIEDENKTLLQCKICLFEWATYSGTVCGHLVLCKKCYEKEQYKTCIYCGVETKYFQIKYC